MGGPVHYTGMVLRLTVAAVIALVAVNVLAPEARALGRGEPPAGGSPVRATPGSAPPSPRWSGTVVLPPAQPTRWRGERISLSLSDADLGEVLRSFARLAGVSLVVDPSVSGKVTVELHDVPWDHALSVILKTHRLGAELDGRLLAVGPVLPRP